MAQPTSYMAAQPVALKITIAIDHRTAELLWVPGGVRGGLAPPESSIAMENSSSPVVCAAHFLLGGVFNRADPFLALFRCFSRKARASYLPTLLYVCIYIS